MSGRAAYAAAFRGSITVHVCLASNTYIPISDSAYGALSLRLAAASRLARANCWEHRSTSVIVEDRTAWSLSRVRVALRSR
jgi:hypothetical protein